MSTSKKPASYCAACTNLLHSDDLYCSDCRKPKPEKGWNSIQDGRDRWLGRILDDRYLITKRVGRGSVGSVYRAKSLAIERVFAIKIINLKQTPGGLSPVEIRARLNREVSAIGKLRNPHMVPFYETLELYDTYLGIVMDFVEGQTLELLVQKEKPLEIDRIMTLLKQIANGLYEAHTAGMTHRDVKPDNLMVERLPAQGDFLHILDFGIVSVDDGVSITNGFLGTPLYASPEQATAGRIDHRSDIYSLGAVLFYMLTGQPPYQSENVYDILRAHVSAEIPKPSTLRVDVPAFLDTLTTKLLAKSPDDRPASLATVIAEIDTFFNLKVRESSELRTFTGNETSELDPVPQKQRKITGAAIFRRAPTRGTLRNAIVETKKLREHPEFDYTLRTETGVHPLGDATDLRLCVSKAGTVLAVNQKNEVWSFVDGDPKKIEQFDFSPTTINPVGDGIWVGTDDGRVFVFEGGEKELIFEDVRRTPIRAIDHRLSVGIAGSDSGRVYIKRREEIWTRVHDGPPVIKVAMSQDATLFAVALKTKELNIYRVSDPKRSRVCHFSFFVDVRSMAFSVKSHLLAVIFEDNSLSIYNVMAGQVLSTIKVEIGKILDISFTQDNELIGFTERKGVIYGVDLQRVFGDISNN